MAFLADALQEGNRYQGSISLETVADVMTERSAKDNIVDLLLMEGEVSAQRRVVESGEPVHVRRQDGGVASVPVDTS